MPTAAEIIRLLNLQPHPVEGGYFRETHRTGEVIPAAVLPAHGAIRSAGTAIYYLLTGPAVSEMHRLPGDEVYHFYLGDPLETLLLTPDGGSELVLLGTDLAAGQVPQLVIPLTRVTRSVGPPEPEFTLVEPIRPAARPAASEPAVSGG